MKVKVIHASEIVEGQSRCCHVEGVKIVLFKQAGKIYAYENKCTHLGLSLEKGKLQNGVVTCPFHGAQFNVETGQNVKWVNSVVGMPLPKWSHKALALGKEPKALKRYEVSIEGDDVYITL